MENIRTVSTGTYISIILEDSGLTKKDLAKASGVSLRTVQRVIDGETKLPGRMAEGLHSLVPGIEPSFILGFDAYYHYKREEERRSLNLKKGESLKIMSAFDLGKLFPSKGKDSTHLLVAAKDIFGLASMKSMDLDPLLSFNNAVRFDKTSNSETPDETFKAKVWLVAAYKEALKSWETDKEYEGAPEPGAGLLDFNEAAFEDLFKNKLRDLSFASSLPLTLFNMEYFCKSCGIRFYFRKSIPNSHIKGVVIKDEAGRVFLIMSDLFTSTDRMWLTFIHELIHLRNGDLDRGPEAQESVWDNESKINSDVIHFFVNTKMDEIQTPISSDEILRISAETDSPKGIVAEIARYKSSTYSDRTMNSFINHCDPKHYGVL